MCRYTPDPTERLAITAYVAESNDSKSATSANNTLRFFDRHYASGSLGGHPYSTTHLADVVGLRCGSSPSISRWEDFPFATSATFHPISIGRSIDDSRGAG